MQTLGIFSHPCLSTAKLLQCQWLLLATQINDHFKPKVGYFARMPNLFIYFYKKSPFFHYILYSQGM